MSEINKTPVAPNTEDVPEIIKKAPELLPVWDWWVKEGKSTLLMVVIAAAAVCAFYGWRNWNRSRNLAASTALVEAYNVEELETAVASYGSTKSGPALRLRLAKAYFDASPARYQDALSVYDKLIASKGDYPEFADIAVVGRAYALEGLSKFKEAGAEFDAFAKANTNSYLVLTAKLGALRCQALAGDKDGAAKGFDALKAATTDEIAKARIEAMADAVKRHDPKRAARSLFDAANDATKALNAVTNAPAAKPAAAAPAPAPAAAKPAAAAPAPAPAAAKPVAAPAPAPAAAKPAAPAPAPAAPAKK